MATGRAYADIDDLLEKRRGERAFLVVLDGIEDPHNLGAIIRTADAAGADGVVIPERRAASVTATVSKASAGASEHVPIARVTNIARTIDELKQRNVWTVGLDERGEKSYDEVDYLIDCALVLGAEGHGLHDLVRRKCDFLVSIPMLGQVPSLNASVAAAVVMYEIGRSGSDDDALDCAPRVDRAGAGFAKAARHSSWCPAAAPDSTFSAEVPSTTENDRAAERAARAGSRCFHLHPLRIGAGPCESPWDVFGRSQGMAAQRLA